MKTFAVLAMAVCMSLAACAREPTKDPAYSGEYFYNFENAIFTPDGKEEDWCLSGISMQKAELPVKDSSGPWGTSHVVLRGNLGPRGSYGGLGRCKHILTVTEIVEINNMRGQGE